MKNTDWNLFWYVLRWNKSGQTMHTQYKQYENRSKRLCQPVNNLGHDSKKTTLISCLTSWKRWRQWRQAQSKHELNSPPFLLWKRVTISTHSSSPKASKVWFLAMEHTFSICSISTETTEPLCNLNVSSDPISFSMCSVCTRTGRMHTGILHRKDACMKFCRS